MSLLEVRALSFAYRSRSVLQEITLDLAPGEILSLLGPNGSGKSTLMKAIAGVLPGSARRPRRGELRYEGIDLATRSLAWRASRVAYVGADISAQFPMTASQVVMLGRSCREAGGWVRLSSEEDRRVVEESMTRCFCWGLRDRELHTLSGGERQLVILARALAQGARVLLLDETLSRMDLNHQAAIGQLLLGLAGQGYSIMLVSHDINIASEWARTAMLMKEGRKAAHGPIREVLNETSMRALYPGSELVVGQSPVTGAPKVFFGRGSPGGPLRSTP